jgi:hypothetical protein
MSSSGGRNVGDFWHLLISSKIYGGHYKGVDGPPSTPL